MERVVSGELEPLIHTRWSINEIGSALKFMQAARHIGKIVLANSPLETGRLRDDRTYLITGGSWRYRLRPGRQARGPGRGRDCAERAPRPRSRGR